MRHNHSVPVDAIMPHVVYDHVGTAIAWLSSTFGFREHFRYGDPAAPSGAQLHLGDAWVMLRESRAGDGPPARLGAWTQSLTVFVPDVNATYERVRAAGAEVTEPLHETEYGERQFGVRDFAGHPWLFSTHARDVDPAEWGATVADGADR